MLAAKDELFTRPSGGYSIARSVRLRSSATAYFNRTQTSGNRRTYTYSAWIKRGNLTTKQNLFGTITYVPPSQNDQSYWSFLSDNTFEIALYSGGSYLGQLITTQVFRDPSAWYHIVVQVDTTQATSSNRLKLYVNGTQVTSFSTTNYPSQNTDTFINANGYGVGIGRVYTYASSEYFDGYMTEINFIDGQALTPSSFGSTNAITGVWQPAKYTGTYGTNGFYLNFSDNSNNTAATIGKDYSGNGNNWTPNNISVTAGVTYDSMQDVPTLTSATAANYCVVDVLSPIGSASALSTVASANLQLTHSGSTYSQRFGNMVVSSGKWYFEFTLTNIGYPSLSVGVSKLSRYPTYGGAGGQATSCAAVGYFTGTDLSVCTEAGGTGAGTISSQTWSNGDIIMVAFSIDTGKIWWGKNGTWYSSGNPAADTNNITTITSSGAEYRPWAVLYGTTTDTSFNFGQRPFSYTPPTGFVALNTYNLPASTITNGAAYMAATTYTGNGSTQSISNAVGSTSFQPDFVWIKLRNQAGDYHNLFDSVRGIYKRLFSNDTNAENTNTDTLTAFNSNGFSVGTNGNVNTNAINIIGWQWKAGTTSASNTNGSITSTVNAGATQGFSVVTYTGNGTNNATVGHGLGVVPSMIILKNRSGAYDWPCYHISIGSGKYIYLNQTATAATDANMWRTTPTSTVFTLGTYTENNGSSNNYVAYCFSAVAGYSAFGSYIGNGTQGAGPFVFLGFRPRYVLVKNASVGGRDWHDYDSSRSPYNYSGSNILKPNTADAELTGRNDVQIDMLSNGFRLIGNDAGINESGATFIYMCFAENPFKNSLAR